MALCMKVAKSYCIRCSEGTTISLRKEEAWRLVYRAMVCVVIQRFSRLASKFIMKFLQFQPEVQ